MSVRIEFTDGTYEDYREATRWEWDTYQPATIHLFNKKTKVVKKETLITSFFSREVKRLYEDEVVETEKQIACVLACNVIGITDTTPPF